MNELSRTWVAGRPAPFATAGERPWKDILAAQMPTPSGLMPSGMVIEFTLGHGLAWPAHPDIDNLCEPVFSTVINRLGWFGGSRPNMDWYLTAKRPGSDPGAVITILGGSAPDVPTVVADPVFTATWPGPLPRSARDEQFTTWVRALAPQQQLGVLAVALEFGGSRVNIGDVATGAVKSVIDCLQPVLGGPVGNPDDHRVVRLFVVKAATGVSEGAVRVTVGSGDQPPELAGISQETPQAVEMPTGPWAVGLVGGKWELGEIAPHFTGAIRVRRAAVGWELTADTFEQTGEAEAIRTRAGEMLELINGVARLRLDAPDPISLGNVRRYRGGNSTDVWVFPEPARARLRMGTPTILVNGIEAAPRSWEPDLQLAARDEKVRAVFVFLSTAPTWHRLYAALDIVLKDRRTGGAAGAQNWAEVSENRLEQFTRTANSYDAVGARARHGPGRVPPKTPMAPADAVALVCHVVERWLDELRKAGA